MGIGCLLKKRFGSSDYIFPFLIIGLIIASIIFYQKNIYLSLGGMTSKSDIFFGGIFYPRRVLKIPIYPALAAIFILVTFILILPARYLGIYFDKFKPLTAYKYNILGSIFGIAFFSLFSYFSVNPFWWFLIIFIVCGFIIEFRIKKIVLWILCLILALAALYKFEYSDNFSKIIWSPYYKIRIQNNIISVNNMHHQQIQTPKEIGSFLYNYPYMLMRESQKKIKDVLIIGAGSGNDVSAAVLNNAENIDAVEIDPVIGEIGKKSHPFKPYGYKNVNFYCDDGRSFLKKTQKKYDIIIYALVDSLTMLSTYSSIRLENYLFTEEAFKEIKNCLKEDGTFIVYNTFIENWLAVKLYQMLGSSFGTNPLMTAYPASEHISIQDKPHQNLTFFIVEKKDKKIAQLFEPNKVFILDNVSEFDKPQKILFASYEESKNYYNKNSIVLFNTKITDKEILRSSIDDWPFLYLRNNKVPFHTVTGILIILILSILMIIPAAKIKKIDSDNIIFLLLGCAFMILETKSVTVFALLFGTTWFVNSIVFFGILVIAYFSNLIIIKRPNTNVFILYFGITATFAAAYLIPVNSLLNLNIFLKTAAIIIITFLPILFGSMLFSKFFKNNSESSVNLGFNLFGVILGGLIENVSLITGYRQLIVIILVLYLITAFSFRKAR